MKTFKFYGADDCYLERDSYAYDGGLYLAIHSLSEGPMAHLTVNLVDNFLSLLGPDIAYLNVNNIPCGSELVERLGIGVNLYAYRTSGFCTYPLYKFDLQKIDEYITDDNKRRLRS